MSNSAKTHGQYCIWRCKSGAAALEFALVSPIFLLMLMGILCYGGYFWISHSVQQIANDAARVTVSGLTANERAALAQGVLASEIGSYGYLESGKAALSISDTSQAVSVTVAYDAANTPFFVLHSLVPMPSPVIRRTAMIRMGGY